MNERGRPFCRNEDTRGVDMDKKRVDTALGVEVTVKVAGVRIAVGEDGNTNKVWDGVFTCGANAGTNGAVPVS